MPTWSSYLCVRYWQKYACACIKVPTYGHPDIVILTSCTCSGWDTDCLLDRVVCFFVCVQHVCSHIHYLTSLPPLPPPSSCLSAHTMRAGSFSCPSSVSLGLMEPDERSGQLRGRGERDRPEAGFNSRESLQALEYLKNVQRIQLRMLCVRVSSPLEKLVVVE